MATSVVRPIVKAALIALAAGFGKGLAEAAVKAVRERLSKPVQT